jgi:DNA modification methylase
MIIHNNCIAEVLLGDCLTSMRTISDRSVQTCVTSPPYFGLRDYGHAGQIGLEETPAAFVAKLVEVFEEVRRVLRDDGTLWLNLGDSYVGPPRGNKPGDLSTSGLTNPSRQDGVSRGAVNKSKLQGLKPKDLIGIPWRVAFALQDAGWYLRQDIIWHKPNPMPESVRDRCTKAHEYVFLLAKSERYYFDAATMQEIAVGGAPGNKRATKGGRAYEDGAAEHRTAANLHAIGARETRNRRTVWTVPTRPYAGAHFATFPPDLIEPCVLAGSPPGGVVLDPFGGSGTTGGVALKHGRHALLCELNADYAALMPERIARICK